MRSQTVFERFTYGVFFAVARRISYGFGICMFSNLFAWISCAYGYFFIIANIDFFPGEWHSFTIQLFLVTLVITLISYGHFGVFKPLGVPGFGSFFPIVNRMLDDDPLGERFQRLSAPEITRLQEYFNKISIHTPILVGIYSVIDVLIVVFLNYLQLSGSRLDIGHNHSLTIFTGGLIASLINTYLSFIMTEFIIAPVRRNLQAEMNRRNMEFIPRKISSYSQNFLFGILLLVFTMVLLVRYLSSGPHSLFEIGLFIFLSCFTIFFIIFIFLQTMRVFLLDLKSASGELASGKLGLLFPSFFYHELLDTALFFNAAAREVEESRLNLGTAIETRTRELKEAKEQAEALNLMKDQFLANISHEIRTPLNGIVGMVELMAATPLTKQQEDYIQIIRESGGALLDIVNAVLDFSQLKNGLVSLHEAPFSLRLLMNSVMDQFSSSASAKGLSMTLTVNPELPSRLKGDASHLRQVLVNLLDNAVKFTDRGEIKIVADLLGEADNHAELLISVSDTGIGIPGDRMGKIFSSFTQADGSLTRRYGGAGLGLTISQEIVRVMGGVIRVESQEGKGSRFYFVIRLAHCDETVNDDLFSRLSDQNGEPQRERPENMRESDFPHAEKSAEGLGNTGTVYNGDIKILLAEDNVVNQKLALALIRKRGWEVKAVNNGQEALDILLDSGGGVREHFHLVLMDVQMPVMDGLEATRRIRKVEKLKKIPIIALTAHALKGDRERFISQGMTDYLPKPIKADVFYKTLEKHLIGRGD